jgi:hypothetical protein
MIRYRLTCRGGHGFDSWFQNAGTFAELQAGGQLVCPVCGVTDVEKALMAPAVTQGRLPDAGPARGAPPSEGLTQEAPPPARTSLTEPQSELETAIAALRRQIEENSDYVGMNFAAEARRMHDGDGPVRAIHGEARPEEARKLIEDGVPVAPLPFMPGRKVN